MHYRFEGGNNRESSSQELLTAREIAEQKADAMIRAAQERKEREMREQQESEETVAEESFHEEGENEQESKDEQPAPDSLLRYLNAEDRKSLSFYYAELEKAEGYGVARQEYADQVRKNIAVLEQRAQERKEIMDREQEVAEISLTKSSLPGKHWEDYNKDIDRQRDATDRALSKKGMKNKFLGWLTGLFR